MLSCMLPHTGGQLCLLVENGIFSRPLTEQVSRLLDGQSNTQCFPDDFRPVDSTEIR